ncbi:MAG: phosphomethylpyrimidine synthase ThiC [Actinobacteria bacterium]|nr:phosphomethylpyrimidine synthase ThiC [Actinomycetota bacterium]
MKPTLLQLLADGNIPESVLTVSQEEQISAEVLAGDILSGKTVIPSANSGRKTRPTGIGNRLRTKVNANIGASSEAVSLDDEIGKLEAAIQAGADAVMDLSCGGDVGSLRRALLSACDIPFGTVPIYEATVAARDSSGSMVSMDADSLMATIEGQAAEGVDFMTIHAGLTRSAIDELQAQGRLMDVVSRGGAFMIAWMLHHDRENPFFEDFDRLLEILARWDVVLSLGDGLRPGCLADASDRAQFSELITLGKLASRAREAGVQTIIEGPGHMPMQDIEANVRLAKKLTGGAPFYVLGPLVTDVAPGYDHITAAIGGAIAGSAGADFLCYVTAAEHLGLPTSSDVRQGVIVSRIAAHAADIAKGIPGALDWDRQMAAARKSLDWDMQISLAIDPQTARATYEDRHSGSVDGCSMCGDLCAMKLVSDHLGVREGEISGC